jgi:hypothetical protein
MTDIQSNIHIFNYKVICDLQMLPEQHLTTKIHHDINLTLYFCIVCNACHFWSISHNSGFRLWIMSVKHDTQYYTIRDSSKEPQIRNPTIFCYNI